MGDEVLVDGYKIAVVLPQVLGVLRTHFRRFTAWHSRVPPVDPSQVSNAGLSVYQRFPISRPGRISGRDKSRLLYTDSPRHIQDVHSIRPNGKICFLHCTTKTHHYHLRPAAALRQTGLRWIQECAFRTIDQTGRKMSQVQHDEVTCGMGEHSSRLMKRVQMARNDFADGEILNA